MNSLAMRQQQPELMDDPALDPSQHTQALRGLSRINRWSRTTHLVWSSLCHLAHTTGVFRLRILDIATGAGDVPLGLWHRAQQSDLQLVIDACDISATAVRYAQAQARRQRATVHFFALDALTQPIPSSYDAVMASLFTHHLTDAETIRLLQRMKAATTRLVLINDLRRSWYGLSLAYLGTRLLSRSPIVHTDGLRSARAAYTMDEIRTLAEHAGLHGCTVERRWPARWLLLWRRA